MRFAFRLSLGQPETEYGIMAWKPLQHVSSVFSFFAIQRRAHLNVERSKKGIVSIERHQIRPHLSFHSALINTRDNIVIPLQ